jgi:DNA replication protein DnaC
MVRGEKRGKALLEEYLLQLRLPTFEQNDEQYAIEASLTCEHSLFALCEAEIAQRKVNRIERALAAAKFPIQKDVSSVDFSQGGGVSKMRV